MSLVNEMLKNLDKRKAKPEPKTLSNTQPESKVPENTQMPPVKKEEINKPEKAEEKTTEEKTTEQKMPPWGESNNFTTEQLAQFNPQGVSPGKNKVFYETESKNDNKKEEQVEQTENIKQAEETEKPEEKQTENVEQAVLDVSNTMVNESTEDKETKENVVSSKEEPTVDESKTTQEPGQHDTFEDFNVNISGSDQKPSNDHQDIDLKALEDKPSQFHISKRMIILLVAIFVILLIWYFWPKKVEVKLNLTKPNVAIQPITPKQKETFKLNISDNAVIQLSKIGLKQVGHLATLQLYFDKTVHYQVHMNQDHSLMTLTLSDVEFKGTFPDTQTSPIIKNISSQTSDKQLKLLIQTEANTEVKKIHYDDKSPFVLDIDLYHPKAFQSTSEVNKTNVLLSKDEIANQGYEEALALISQDKLNASIFKLKQVLWQAHNFVPARRTLVTLLIKQGKLPEASRYIDAGLKDTPDEVSLITLKARVLFSENRLQAALKELNHVSPQLKGNLDYYALMALIQQNLGNNTIAANLYEQLLKIEPRNANWWLGLGLSLENSNKPNMAVQAYHKALNSGGLKPGLQAYVQAKISQLSGSTTDGD